ncbi:MAG: SRPBCC domain-containing protein [Methyloceanibacter sp.]
MNRLTLTEQDGKTTLTLRGAPVDATEEERKTFAGMFTSMQQGFTGTFDQLAAYLAKA